MVNSRKWVSVLHIPATEWKTLAFLTVLNDTGIVLQESGAGDEDKDYVQRVMIHYEIETEIPFKLRHWSKGSKRHKSSGSSSFNTESGEASINLNTNVGDSDEDEVQEIRRLEGMDKARGAGKNKGSKASGSTTVNEDPFARLMVTEMTAQEKEDCLAFLEIKRREVECREREIEQLDMRFYLQPYDHLSED
ncbi:hypothetical protein Tco_0055313 [Tanacetum coccineum]